MATHHFCLIELSSGGRARWNFWYLHYYTLSKHWHKVFCTFCTSAEIAMTCHSMNLHLERLDVKRKTRKTLQDKTKSISFWCRLKTTLVSTSPVVKVIKERAYLSNGIPALGLEPIQRSQTSFHTERLHPSLSSTSAFAESIPTTSHYNHELTQIAVEDLQISTFSF